MLTGLTQLLLRLLGPFREKVEISKISLIFKFFPRLDRLFDSYKFCKNFIGCDTKTTFGVIPWQLAYQGSGSKIFWVQFIYRQPHSLLIMQIFNSAIKCVKTSGGQLKNKPISFRDLRVCSSERASSSGQTLLSSSLRISNFRSYRTISVLDLFFYLKS